MDGADSLADDAGYADVAKALDVQEVYAAVPVVPAGIDPAQLLLDRQVSPDQPQVLVEQLEEQLPAASYNTVGISVPATLQRLPEGLRETEGSVVVATSRPAEDAALKSAYQHSSHAICWSSVVDL